MADIFQVNFKQVYIYSAFKNRISLLSSVPFIALYPYFLFDWVCLLYISCNPLFYGGWVIGGAYC